MSNMSKPRTFKCKNYCEDYSTCTRTSCSRSILFENGVTKMVEKDKWNYYRIKEKLRLYNEGRNCKVNN